MKDLKRFRSFEERFIIFSNFFEKVIIKLLIFALILLILSQAVLSIDGIRAKLVPVERLEGSLSTRYLNIY